MWLRCCITEEAKGVWNEICLKVITYKFDLWSCKLLRHKKVKKWNNNLIYFHFDNSIHALSIKHQDCTIQRCHADGDDGVAVAVGMEAAAEAATASYGSGGVFSGCRERAEERESETEKAFRRSVREVPQCSHRRRLLHSPAIHRRSRQVWLRIRSWR